MQLADLDEITCLCVDVRCNDWEKLENEFSKRGANFNKFIVGKGNILPKEYYNFIDPVGKFHINSEWRKISTENGYYGYLSHREILKNALNKNVKNILMLEDDCEFLDNFDDILEKASNQLDENNIQWDMLYLGSNHTWAKTKEISPNLLKCLGGTSCWHAVIINQEYNNIIKELLELPPLGVFDWLTAQYIQPKYNCVAVWPSIAIQKPGISYVLNGIQDYTHYFSHKGELQ